MDFWKTYNIKEITTVSPQKKNIYTKKASTPKLSLIKDCCCTIAYITYIILHYYYYGILLHNTYISKSYWFPQLSKLSN